MTLCCLPAFALANETGESCSKIEDSAKRLECYDSVFVKKILVKMKLPMKSLIGNMNKRKMNCVMQRLTLLKLDQLTQ